VEFCFVDAWRKPSRRSFVALQRFAARLQGKRSDKSADYADKSA
jgi:hypothetical protein